MVSNEDVKEDIKVVHLKNCDEAFTINNLMHYTYRPRPLRATITKNLQKFDVPHFTV